VGILITGATDGLGRALADRLAATPPPPTPSNAASWKPQALRRTSCVEIRAESMKGGVRRD